MTRRGDFEILAYNIVRWLGGTLPWMNNLKNPKLVHQQKEEAMNDVPKFLKQAFGNKPVNGSNNCFFLLKIIFNIFLQMVSKSCLST